MKKRLLISIIVLGCAFILLGIILQPSMVGRPDADPILQPGTFRYVRKIRAALMLLGFSAIALAVMAHEFGQKVLKHLSAALREYDDFHGTRSGNERAIDLFLVSFLGLFFEILIIRWLSTEVRIFAYFKNLPLISCFLGLGVGFSLSNRKTNLYPLFPFLMCALATLILLLPQQFLSHYPSQTEFVWAFGPGRLATNLAFYFGFIFLFLFNMVAFLPLGQLTGKLMQGFPPIKAYTINILGSLLGTWAFSAMSFFSLSPMYWFIFGFAITLWLLRSRRYLLLSGAFSIGVYLIILFANQGYSIWSPYYKIDIAQLQHGRLGCGYSITVNQDYHQKALNLSEDFVRENAEDVTVLSRYSYAYNLPYHIVQPRKVLVVGAGTGNDVSAALRNGAEEVHAVEIDPGILKIGKKLHPESPYQSPKVKAIVDDARSFLHKSHDRYDIIVYGLLDSHTLLSSMSSVRLDNFVYTIESLRDARSHLTDNGVISLTFSVGRHWIGQRLFNMLTEVFGEEPIAIDTSYDGGVMFLAGPGMDDFDPDDIAPPPWGGTHNLRNYRYDRRVSNTSDDWPYLYMEKRGIPRVYWIMIVLILGVSAMVVLRAFPEALNVDFHFFFLGSAFLLIEVKSITELALVFGSTWIINSIVISAILVMVLLANLYVSRIRTHRIWIYYVLLMASLAASYIIPLQSLLQQSLVTRGLISSAVVSIPLFFAGVIFATSLKKTKRIEIAFGSNLLGAMLGGFFEYASLSYGIKNLSIFAGVMYILSFVALMMRRKV